MRHAYDVERVRAAEAVLMARSPAGELMRRAAAGLAAVCAELLGSVYGSRVVLLVGSGDNGGDALFAGAILARRGARVDAIALDPDRMHQAAAEALRAAGGVVRPDRATGSTGAGDDRPVAALLDAADLVLDGIVGIGGRGGLRPRAAALVESAELSGATIVAVDLPSGVDASTGRVDGPAVTADVTVTFGAWKVGLLVDPGAAHAGQVRLVDIGLGGELGAAPLAVLDDADVALALPQPGPESDKYRRGVVGVLAGSEQYVGAAVLAVGGALHAAAGMVRFCSAQRAVQAVLARWPEVIATTGDVAEVGRVQAWVAGPGMGTDAAAASRLRAVLDSDVPVLVDADGLTLLAKEGLDKLIGRGAPTVLTPHAGEAGRLLGVSAADVAAARLEHARLLARRTGATVLLKGETTLVVGPEGPARVNTTATPWLGTAGSGDVLSGLIGSLLAGGLPALDAAAIGAHLHGRAATLASGGGPITAFDVITALPSAWRSVR